jgi:hypothetical protein
LPLRETPLRALVLQRELRLLLRLENVLQVFALGLDAQLQLALNLEEAGLTQMVKSINIRITTYRNIKCIKDCE